jgi:hypothetical protein
LKHFGAVLGLLVMMVSGVQAQRPTRHSVFADTAITTSTQGVAFVASAILPGAGQYYLKSDRWVPFAAAEVWAWVEYSQHHKTSGRWTQAYRDLAWNVARRFTTSARLDSVWEYYEAMSAWRESGAFDVDAQQAGLQPEIDSTTFNGAQWQRARALFLRGRPPVLGSPEYEQALAYYRSHAIPDLYLWSWANSRLEQQEFVESIGRSDAAYRTATTMMGVILANHLVSAVDALIMARVKTLQEHHIRIGSTVEPGPDHHTWTVRVQIPLSGVGQ